MLAKTAAYFGGTGPVIDEGVEIAQGKLREGLEKLAKLSAVGAAAHEVTEAERAISAARSRRAARRSKPHADPGAADEHADISRFWFARLIATR